MAPILRAIRQQAAADAGRTALSFDGQTCAYGPLADRVARVAAWLAGQGVRPGQVVALMMGNSAAFVEIAVAVNALGAIYLPVNTRLAPPEAEWILRHSGASLLIADDDLAASAPAADVILDAAARRDIAGAFGLSAGAFDAVVLAPGDPFRIMYTSGTTGRPKGVIHTAGNFAWKLLDQIAVLPLGRGDRILVCGPLFHVGGADLPGLGILALGGELHIQRGVDADRILATIAEAGITGLWLAPAMLARLIDHGGVAGGALHWCIGGGERTPERRIRDFERLFPTARYVDSYGMTETCSGDTFMPAGWEIDRIGSVGIAAPNIRIRICDDDGRDLPAGTDGEICLRGPKVTPGYWRDPDRTAEAFRDGWLRSGDIGHLDADGFLTLTDRRKDMIISGGENISPGEIERVLLMHPDLAEAAVIGVPDATWGERPLAFVVARPRTAPAPDALLRHCAAHLARFKLPGRILIMADLPRNASGKVMKHLLRARPENSADTTDTRGSDA